MKHLNTPQDLFFSRQDPEDPRLGEFAGSDRSALVTLWGYPDDEGIRLNGGRPGAALAPQAIRRALYRMTPARNWPRRSLIDDKGDFLPGDELDMAAKAIFLKNKVSGHYQQSGSFLVTLGGGHDYGFPDGAGFVEAFANDGIRPLVLNFDAHLDVRPLDRGLTSGTPFRRLLEDYKDRFDFFEVGILPHCNSPFHWEWAESQGAFVLSGENIKAKGLKDALEQSLTSGAPADSFVKRPLWISLDIDCFSASEAPGCSAPNPFGLKVDEFMDLWPWLFQNFDVKGLGIYEVSPSLDVDNRTSRLAAFMIHASMNELVRNQLAP